jgi:O-antigen/teichoic acid export membrane protein
VRLVTGGAGRRILANLSWLIGGKGASALLGMAYLAVTARALGPASFGDFTVIVAGTQLLVALVSFQSWQIIGRYGPALRGRGLPELLGLAAVLDGFSAMIGAALGVIAAVLAGRHFGWSDDLRTCAQALVLASMLSLRSTPVGMLRLEARFGAAVAAESVVPVVRLLGAAAAAWFSTGAGGFLIAWACAELASGLACWGLALRSSVRPRWRGWAIAHSCPGFWGFAKTTHVLGSLGAGSKQLTVLIVAAVLDPAAAGLYRIAAQFAQAVGKSGQLVSRAALSEFSALATAGVQQMNAELRLLCAGLGVCSALAMAAAVTAGPAALELLVGEAFPSLAAPFILIAAACAIKVVASPLEPALLSIGAERAVLVGSAAVMVGELLLSAVLGSTFGLAGAAAGALVAGAASASILVVAWQTRVRAGAAV